MAQALKYANARGLRKKQRQRIAAYSSVLTGRLRRGIGQRNLKFKVIGERELPQRTRIIGLFGHSDDFSLGMGRTAFALTRPEKGNVFHSFILASGHKTQMELPEAKWRKGTAVPAGDSQEFAERQRSRRAAMRRLESSREAKILGTKGHFMNLNFYDTKRVSGRDVEIMAREILPLNPRVLFIPNFMDKSHPDHALTSRLGTEIAKEMVKRTGRPVEIWEYTETTHVLPAMKINTYVASTKEASEAWLRAVQAHKSQLARSPFDKIEMGTQLRLQNVVGKALAGYGSAPGETPEVEAFIRYRLALRNGRVVREEV